MSDEVELQEGLRARKRRETLDRIAKEALKLFARNGYEQTTLDAIAEASGISRRTFFHYFKSKEDVLLAYEGSGIVDFLRPAILAQSPEQLPLDVGRKCLLDLASRYETKESIVADRLLRSTEALRARKEALFVEMERVLVEAFQELWPEEARRDALRVAAMIVMGTMRLALDNWRVANGERPLAYYIEQGFVLVREVLPGRE